MEGRNHLSFCRHGSPWSYVCDGSPLAVQKTGIAGASPESAGTESHKKEQSDLFSKRIQVPCEGVVGCIASRYVGLWGLYGPGCVRAAWKMMRGLGWMVLPDRSTSSRLLAKPLLITRCASLSISGYRALTAVQSGSWIWVFTPFDRRRLEVCFYEQAAFVDDAPLTSRTE